MCCYDAPSHNFIGTFYIYDIYFGYVYWTKCLRKYTIYIKYMWAVSIVISLLVIIYTKWLETSLVYIHITCHIPLYILHVIYPYTYYICHILLYILHYITSILKYQTFFMIKWLPTIVSKWIYFSSYYTK